MEYRTNIDRDMYPELAKEFDEINEKNQYHTTTDPQRLGQPKHMS